jgi:hypothetical protein
MATVPNIEGTVNPAVLSGGVFGTVIGGADGPLGFYGVPGVAQQSGTGITTVAELVAALQAVGLLGA